MGKVFTFLLGKNKAELEELLAQVVKKLEANPENERLIEEKEALERAIQEA